MYELTHMGNQGDQQTTDKMQRDLFHCPADNTGQQRHTRAQALLGLVHPSEQQRGLLPAPINQSASRVRSYHKAVLL